MSTIHFEFKNNFDQSNYQYMISNIEINSKINAIKNDLYFIDEHYEIDILQSIVDMYDAFNDFDNFHNI